MSSLAAPAVALAALLMTPGVASSLGEEKDDKPDRPELDIRATPRTGFSPLSVLFTLELKEGGDHEDYYCPELEWEWGDGDRSIQESDCDPWVPGETKITRRYTNRHLFRFSGVYTVTVRLKRVDRTIARITHRLTVRQGAGERYPQD
jgi:hypothetical protein